MPKDNYCRSEYSGNRCEDAEGHVGPHSCWIEGWGDLNWSDEQAAAEYQKVVDYFAERGVVWPPPVHPASPSVVFGPGLCHGCGQPRRVPSEGGQFACWNDKECPLFGVVSVEPSGPQASDDYATLLAERDELWAAMQRVASNLCSCHAEPGGTEPPPVYPAEHSETCTYAAAHAPIAQEDAGPIVWDDPNFSLA